MSRSRKREPVAGIAADSDKPGKVHGHRRLRKRNKQRLRAGMEPIDEREVSDPWNWPKDGKYRSPDDPTVRRK